jgi:hypothetical protein
MPKTAYGKLMEEQRRKRKSGNSRGGAAAAAAKNGGVTCGAQKRKGGKCSMAAGWGTIHPGIGKCKLHGGSMPNHVKSAAREEHRRLLGRPREVNPYEAILECIRIRAGEVEWLSNEMSRLQEKSWVEETLVGKQFHLYARERGAAMNDLVRYSQIAVSLGIADRIVKLAETYGEMLANYTRGILDDLWPHLDEEGRKNAPIYIRRHLIALDGGLKDQPLAIPEETAA